MGPFIDPGSRGFEEPDRFGYRLFARTLEEHRRLLVQPTWEHILNYETKWMTRRELVDATYDAAERLNELKVQHGRISKRRGRARCPRHCRGACAARRGSMRGWPKAAGRARMLRCWARYRASAFRRYATSASCSGRAVSSISRLPRSRASSAGTSADVRRQRPFARMHDVKASAPARFVRLRTYISCIADLACDSQERRDHARSDRGRN